MKITINPDSLSFDLKAVIAEKTPLLNKALKNITEQSENPNEWLGWTNLAHNESIFQDIQEKAQELQAKHNFQDLAVIGIGGSALGPQALSQALLHPLWNSLPPEKRNNKPRLHFFDNVDPDWNAAILSELDPRKTLFCVITKSGGTAETISVFLKALELLKGTVGEEHYKQHLVMITDPEKGPLRAFAREHGILSFAVPPHVGGRFSVFTPVGLFPLAMVGISPLELRKGLLEAASWLKTDKLDENPAVQLACALHHADRELGCNINPLFIYSSKLARIADWYVQLVAESLGKNAQTGPTPLKAVGATDQHSQLQLFAEGPKNKILFFLKVLNFDQAFALPKEPVAGFEDLAGESLLRLIHAEGEGTAMALTQVGVPNLCIELERVNPANVAALLYLFQLMTALAGALYGIDAFNQPGVELSKKLTYALLGKTGFEKYLTPTLNV